MTDFAPLLAAAGVTPRRPPPTTQSAAGTDSSAVSHSDESTSRGVGRRWIAVLAITELAATAAWVASWWVLGAAVLEPGGLGSRPGALWAVLLASSVAAKGAAVWAAARNGIHIGGRVRRRLIEAVTSLTADPIRDHGIGRLLGVVLEANLIETTTINGGLAAATGLAYLAGSVIAIAASSIATLWIVLAVWVALIVGAAAGFVRARTRWHQERSEQSVTLTERLVGHRTVQLQDDPETRTRTDELALDRYEQISRTMDRYDCALTPVPERIAVLCGLTAIAIAAADHPTSGVLLGFGAIALLVTASQSFALAALNLTDSYLARRAINRLESLDPQPVHDVPTPLNPVEGVVTATAATVHHDDRPVLDHIDLTIAVGQRTLLTGPSGAGKTTLAELLAGVREPDSGTIAHRGTVALVPQHDDNHVFLGSLAFNLLLGVNWPPSPDDLDRAEHVCREVGLGPLIEAMPSGIFENIGETGWQLSHGEQACLYLARALLTQPDLAIVDETFGTLDPHTLAAALTTAVNHTPATLVIAHP